MRRIEAHLVVAFVRHQPQIMTSGEFDEPFKHFGGINRASGV